MPRESSVGLVAIQSTGVNMPADLGAWGVLLQENREDGLNPSRSRRCIRGRTPHTPLRSDSWEGAASRVIREPEDLPRSRSILPAELASDETRWSDCARLLFPCE